MKLRFIIFFLPVFLLFAGCSSTKDAKKNPPPKKKYETSRESAWSRFMAKQKEEEKNFHRMDSMQMDNFSVYPWRDGKRRSQKVYEQRKQSVFTGGWW